MKIIGLTGSIAMGKSVAAKMFRRLGLPVRDSDATIHRLLAKGGAGVAPVAKLFPDAIIDGAVDRRKLGAKVFADPAALAHLEAILHPLARQDMKAFLDRHRRRRTKRVVLDVPLLLETGLDAICDVVVVVSASPTIQRMRALARPGMNDEKLAGILARQMPDSEKRRRADIVAVTALGYLPTLRALKRAIRQTS
ncbi:MAG: dephospho-CoA kinase [Alphaproteobacteria bacterium]|nr:dephospho-CoA kinase [Alphaproteobacteria bacterium]MCA0448398.1 dephospho-CoA kinase [Pseudomonadota bacterium]